MKRLFLRLLTLLCLLTALGLSAAPAMAQDGALSAGDVRSAVQTWVRTVPVEGRQDAVVADLEPYQENGETVAYVAHLAGGGFCLTGADTGVLPVYFYNPQGAYDPNNPEYRAILEEIGERRRLAQEAQAGNLPLSGALQAALDSRLDLWRELIAGRAPAKSVSDVATLAQPSYLLLPFTPLWHQGAPYFNQLPILTPGSSQHTAVGCNATATVQIMYYWKWPASGISSHCISYPYRYRSNWDSTALSASVTIPNSFAGRLRYDSGSHQLQVNGYWDDSVHNAAIGLYPARADYQTALATLWSRLTQDARLVCGDFGAATYNWAIMRDTNADPPDAAGQEAAKISAHVAVGVDSALGAWSTGSYFGNDVHGLVSYFRYDAAALYTRPPSDGGPGADIASLTTEITWGRPAGLGGGRADGGHAWVVDGYDKSGDPNRLFHMNLGWGGDSNGWYTLDSAPFPLNHDMMSLLAPTTVKFVTTSWPNPGTGSPDQPYFGIERAAQNAPAGSLLMLQAGSEYHFTGGLVIDRALTLNGFGAVIR